MNLGDGKNDRLLHFYKVLEITRATRFKPCGCC